MTQENITYTTQKSQFQRIYGIAEDFIESLKEMYPLNYSQIIRANYNTLLIYIIITLSLCAALYMTSSILLAIVVAIVGAVYPFVFAFGEEHYNKDLKMFDDVESSEKRNLPASFEVIKLLSDNPEIVNNKEEFEKRFQNIVAPADNTSKNNVNIVMDDIISQLDTLADYPDVKKYRDDFKNRAYAIIAEKSAIKKRFNAVFGTIKVILWFVFMLTFAYPFIIEQPSLFSERIADVADVQPQTPHFTISSFCGNEKIGGESIDFYVNPVSSDPTTGKKDCINICARNVSIPGAQQSDKLYCAITDQNGVPLCDDLTVTTTCDDINIFGIRFGCTPNHETVTLLNYLKEHQKDLKLSIEKW